MPSAIVLKAIRDLFSRPGFCGVVFTRGLSLPTIFAPAFCAKCCTFPTVTADTLAAVVEKLWSWCIRVWVDGWKVIGVATGLVFSVKARAEEVSAEDNA